MSDVIELNEHRLLNGDATNREDVNRLIGDSSVDLLLTDPPYGIDIVKIGGGNWRSKTTNLQEQSEHPPVQASKWGGGDKVW